MDKKMDKESLEFFEELLKKEGLSRRDALKIFGLGGAATLMGSTSAQAATRMEASSDANAHILIVGGGSAGIMAAVRLRKAASNAKITLISPNEIHLYQPGQIFIAAGLYTPDEIKKSNTDLIPSGVAWVKDEVSEFDPESNSVMTRGGQTIHYDFLVVAAGMQYNYGEIEGMSAEFVGTKGISSVYLNNPEAGTAKGGETTWQWFQDLRDAAKTAGDKKLEVICTQPDTPIKCGGAPQKILYLADDFLRRAGVHQNVHFTFTKKGDKLFSLPGFNKALEEVTATYGNITDKWDHVLRKIDPDRKIATFEHRYQVKGAYDEDLEMYDMIDKSETVEMPYDFIHVVPPMSAPDAVRNSLLGWQKGSSRGWLEVDRNTLQHRRYKNIFGMGDVCGIPLGKTGGSARHHGPVMTENLIAVMNGKEPTATFDGYTVCPLKVEYGKIIMAEFNYDGPAPTFPLDPTVPRWLWWEFDLYMLKPMYWHLMMRGLM